MKQLGHWFQYLLFLIASALLYLLPFRSVQRIGARLSEFFYSILGFRKSITLENLRYAFPDESEENLDRIARKAFRNVGSTLAELLWFPRMSVEMMRTMIVFEDEQLIRECHRKGTGFILLTAHFGNWELISPAVMACMGIPVSALYKQQSNRFIDRAIERRRSRFGNTLVPLGPAVREIVRTLQEGHAILLAADQSAPKESIWLDFFGRSIPVFQGPAVLSLKTGAPLLLAFMIREGNGTFRLICREVRGSDLSYSEEASVELTRRHLKETENMIRRYPEQWMWMHRRWKHAVGGVSLGVET